jgi:hypothetical protein
MSEMSLPAAPPGFHWDQDLYSDDKTWFLVKNHVVDPAEVQEQHLLKFKTLSEGYILWNRIGSWNLTNLSGLNMWGNIPQTTSAKPRALTFYSTDPSSSLTQSILTNPGILEEADIYHLQNSFQTMMISTSEELHDFVRDFQNPTIVSSNGKVDMRGILMALCTMETYQEVTFTEPSDLYKVSKIQWKKVQDAGFYGWFIDPSLHQEAMQYQWYRQIGSPMGFVWDIRAFPNPTEDLMRIPFS